MGFKRPEVRIFSLGPGKVLKPKGFGTFLFLFHEKLYFNILHVPIQNSLSEQSGEKIYYMTDRPLRTLFMAAVVSLF